MSKRLAVLLLHVPIALLQLLVGQLLGFGLAWQFGVGDGLELVVIPLGSAVGVLLVGVLSLALRNILNRRELLRRAVSTAIGAILSVLLTLLPFVLPIPFLGYAGVFVMLVGALLGFYLSELLPISRRRA